VGAGDRLRRHVPRRGRGREGRVPARRGRPRLARRARAARPLRHRRRRGERQRPLGRAGRARGRRVHLTASAVDWYAARAGGIAAYVLLTVVVSLGLGLAGKEPRRRWPKFAVEEV